MSSNSWGWRCRSGCCSPSMRGWSSVPTPIADGQLAVTSRPGTSHGNTDHRALLPREPVSLHRLPANPRERQDLLPGEWGGVAPGQHGRTAGRGGDPRGQSHSASRVWIFPGVRDVHPAAPDPSKETKADGASRSPSSPGWPCLPGAPPPWLPEC